MEKYVEEKIAEYLKDAGITQAFVSKKAKIEPQKLCLAFHGKRKLTIEEYSHICWALGVGIDFFLSPTPPNPE